MYIKSLRALRAVKVAALQEFRWKGTSQIRLKDYMKYISNS